MVTLKQSPEDFIVNEKMTLTLGSGKHSIFLLKKRNLNTIQAIDYIKKACNLKDKDIGYAGIKDKFAVTSQYISISKPKEYVLTKDFPFELDYIGQTNQQLYIGGLEGNEFIITARDCQSQPKKKTNIINYFGEQRFSENNIEIGRFLVKKRYEDAVKLLLQTQNEYHKSKLQQMLDKDSRDFVSALRNLPVKLVQLYTHAYQSYIWNKVVSELVKQKDSNYTIDKTLHVAIPSKDLQMPPIPIMGFFTDEDIPEEVEDIVDSVLEEESLSPRDFINKSMPELSLTGNMRNSIVELSNVHIETIDKSTYKIHFFLPKGSYATVTTRQLFSS